MIAGLLLIFCLNCHKYRIHLLYFCTHKNDIENYFSKEYYDAMILLQHLEEIRAEVENVFKSLKIFTNKLTILGGFSCSSF